MLSGPILSITRLDCVSSLSDTIQVHSRRAGNVRRVDSSLDVLEECF